MKRYEFRLNSSLYQDALRPIRKKHDLLRLLAKTLKFLITAPVENPHTIPDTQRLILYVDNMSRLVFCVEDKIFTFCFPLQVVLNPEDDQSLIIHYQHLIEIDSIVSSLLLAVLASENLFECSLESISEKVLNEACHNEWDAVDLESVCNLIKHLMLFEPGYLRYDHDLKHEKGAFHPEHHLDIFYSSSNTFKLGLQNAIGSEWMLDMLDTETKCQYIR